MDLLRAPPRNTSAALHSERTPLQGACLVPSSHRRQVPSASMIVMKELTVDPLRPRIRPSPPSMRRPGSIPGRPKPRQCPCRPAESGPCRRRLPCNHHALSMLVQIEHTRGVDPLVLMRGRVGGQDGPSSAGQVPVAPSSQISTERPDGPMIASSR